MLSQAQNIANKRAVSSAMQAIARARPDDLTAQVEAIYRPEAHWRGSHPWNEMRGPQAIVQQVWLPLRRAFPDLERRDLIVLGGRYEDRDYVGMVSHLCGTFRADWLGIPPTDQVISLRTGEFHQIEGGRIVQSTVLLDVLDFIRQAGFWPIAPSLGQEGLWHGPLGEDGLLFETQDPLQSAASLAQSLAMQATLGNYNDDGQGGRQGLLSMPQKDHWHPQMMWYGPSGIGTTRGLEGFVDRHQLPFRTAFPRDPSRPQPAGMGRHGGSHYVRIGDGRFSATGGWPSRHMMHAGGGWLGLAATGRPVTMRVMDFYRQDEGLIRENWVPIDLIHVLLQLGVDVLARVRDRFAPVALRGSA